MKFLMVVIIYMIGWNIIFGQIDLKEIKKQLLLSNEIQRTAHLNSDADLLANEIADSMITLNEGNIQWASNQTIRKNFSQYFKTVKYTSWDDTQQPQIFISDDGTQASMYVQKLLDVQSKDETGFLGEHQFNLFAWNTDYRLINGKWKIIGITSTDRDLTEKQAREMRIKHSTTHAIIEETNLIPEGIAFDENTKTTYLSSTYKQKIVAINSDGSIHDFKTIKEDGLWSTLGMEVDEKRNRLWVVSFHGNEVLPLMDPEPENEWKSRLYVYQVPDGKLINTLEPEIDGPFAFNDLCVDQNGGVYVTESLNNQVYYLPPEKETFHKLPIQDSLFIFPNGITISDNDRFLYIASNRGIVQYNLQDQKFSFLNKLSDIDDGGLDGLSYYKGSLIGNQPSSNRIMQFFLDESNATITSQKIVEANHPDFDQPTTGEISEGHFIYLANAQMRSGFENGKIKSEEDLKPVLILKVKLD